MKMIDTITQIGKGTWVQHGKHNDRIYVLKCMEEDADTLVDKLTQLAEAHHYSKIICKIQPKTAPLFWADGYQMEGFIPGFYEGKEDVFFVSKFVDRSRMDCVPSAALKALYSLLATPISLVAGKQKAEGYSFRRLSPADVQAMVGIYVEVFSSYPFPIHDPAYILQTMEENVRYFGAFKEGRLAAIASSEMDRKANNAEMTDFATHPGHTGHKLAYHLLRLMEEEMKQLGMITLYTIARLNSIPMNKTFLQMGYKFSGTLLHNTHIAGEIETMVLYYKTVVRE